MYRAGIGWEVIQQTYKRQIRFSANNWDPFRPFGIKNLPKQIWIPTLILYGKKVHIIMMNIDSEIYREPTNEINETKSNRKGL